MSHGKPGKSADFVEVMEKSWNFIPWFLGFSPIVVDNLKAILAI